MRKIITFILYSKTHLYYGAGIPNVRGIEKSTGR